MYTKGLIEYFRHIELFNNYSILCDDTDKYLDLDRGYMKLWIRLHRAMHTSRQTNTDTHAHTHECTYNW